MTEELLKRIEVNPAVMLGKPVIRGTRIPVELILRKFSEGATEEDLQEAYPRLEKKDIQAAFAYAQAMQGNPYKRLLLNWSMNRGPKFKTLLL